MIRIPPTGIINLSFYLGVSVILVEHYFIQSIQSSQSEFYS